MLKWHKCSVQGRDSLEDDEHTGQPRVVRTELAIEEVATLVRVNHSQSVDEVAAAAISHGTCRKILSDDLNMPRVTEQCRGCRDTRPM
jgi:hypothetical protein